MIWGGGRMVGGFYLIRLIRANGRVGLYLIKITRLQV